MKQIENYNHKLTEKKWQKFWADNSTFYFNPSANGEKFYMLPMFLYPSGEMHLGHLRNFSISDVIVRFKRLQGYNVLHPTGADAFGLPAENAAIKKGIHPSEWTYKNLDKIMKSMLACGLSFDTSRIFATCDPEYYGFQQKIFIDLYKHGLAFQKESYVNWDPVDQTVLANEQVINGRGWRSDAPVEKKKLKQWFLKITKYADELLDCIKNGDLKGWPEKVRLMQENWIGKSEGATVRFNIVKSNEIENFLSTTLCKNGVSEANTTPAPICKGGAHEVSGGLTASLHKNGTYEATEDLTKRYTPYNKDLVKKAQELRKNQTPLEKKFWYDVLSNKNFKNLKWTRQKPIDNYIVDFFCNELMLAIELDGDSHSNQVKYDLERTKKLNELGIEVIRYTNKDVYNNLEGLYLDLEERVDKRLKELKNMSTPLPTSSVSPLTKGSDGDVDFVGSSIIKGDNGSIDFASSSITKEGEWCQIFNFIEVYTTRPDTLYGASFVGISPNHPLAEELAKNNKEIADFIEECKKAPVDEESLETMEKKGTPTGIFVEHPFDKNWKLPVWIANFILMDYGTGAIFACPAHDQRDYEFAKKYDLPIKPVVAPKNEFEDIKKNNFQFSSSLCSAGTSLNDKLPIASKLASVQHCASIFNFQLPYTDEGIAINSDFLNGLPTKEAKQKAIEKIEELGIGERKINYRLRDWGVSRQRYWGCPIPMVYCEDCGVVPEKEENLPIKLPEDVVFDGKGNPLANHPTWKYTTCPHCGKPAIRETDTMDTFVDSSWYFARFVDLDKKNPVNRELCNKILPIDQYVGGIEHATMHLIYSRFFTKVMADMGYFDKSIREPAKRLFNQGMVCHKAYRNGKKEWCYPWNVKEENGKYFDINTGEELSCEGIIKMSKSKCNVVDINTIIEDYGADAARLFVLSDTPADKDFEWTTEGIEGSWKYINRIWKLGAGFAEENDIGRLKNIKITKVNDLLKENHRAIKAVSSFLDSLEFNKAIARIRELSNTIEKAEIKDEEDLAIKYLAIKNLIKLLSPFTPHLCEELNELLGGDRALDKSNWPAFDEALTVDNEITIAIQVNGKLRGEIVVKKDLTKEEIEELAKNQENVKKHLEGKDIKKIIVVPNRLVNFVI